MGNFVSVLSHCWGRGFEVLMGDQSHIHLDEQGGMAQVCMCLCGISINAKRLAVSVSFAWGLFSYSQQGEVSRDPSSGAICTHELRLL